MGDFTIIQSNTQYITYIKLDDAGEQVDLVAGDKCTFLAKKNLKQTDYDIEVESTTIEDGQIVIKLSSTDTDIALGDYYYSIELTEDSTGDNFTVSRGILTIDWSLIENE